ncbi:MAG: hypothetical protein AB1451_11975 [Nitrospirota bacterium]
MKSVFAGGSRKVTRLNAEIRKRLDQIIAKHLSVLVGDANGADKAIQKYLSDRQYDKVVVFCTADACRNNLGEWAVRSVAPPHETRDFAFFTAKDAAMAREAEYGFMLWDGESAGTIVNVARLVAAGKPVVIYLSPRKIFVTLKSRQELDVLLHEIPAAAAARVKRYIAEHAREFEQQSMFGAA